MFAAFAWLFVDEHVVHFVDEPVDVPERPIRPPRMQWNN